MQPHHKPIRGPRVVRLGHVGPGVQRHLGGLDRNGPDLRPLPLGRFGRQPGRRDAVGRDVLGQRRQRELGLLHLGRAAELDFHLVARLEVGQPGRAIRRRRRPAGRRAPRRRRPASRPAVAAGLPGYTYRTGMPGGLSASASFPAGSASAAARPAWAGSRGTDAGTAGAWRPSATSHSIRVVPRRATTCSLSPA